MSGKLPAKTKFLPHNPEKYVGKYPITLRSNWEREYATYLDQTEDVLEWAWESQPIPYRDPLADRQSIYIPDAIVTFKDARGQLKRWMVEIKPAHEALHEQVGNDRDAAAYVKNQAKWAAAAAWCQRRGIEFKVFTEQELFGQELKPRSGVTKPKKGKPPTLPTKPTRPRQVGEPARKPPATKKLKIAEARGQKAGVSNAARSRNVAKSGSVRTI